MRWSAVVCVAFLAGCQQLQPIEAPTALPGPFPTGTPTEPVTLAGQTWQRCTSRQMRQYPPALDEPASTYYSGPWCRVAEDGTTFMWVYARPMSPEEQPQEVRGYVNTDAGLLVRNLRTTGYGMVSSSDKGEDVRYEARRPTSPNLVSVDVLGADPPPAGQTYAGTDPLRLEVALRKAGPTETPVPTP